MIFTQDLLNENMGVCIHNIGLTNYLLIFKTKDDYWKSASNRRIFLLEFAKRKKFDPFELENWQTIKKEEITQQVTNRK